MQISPVGRRTASARALARLPARADHLLIGHVIAPRHDWQDYPQPCPSIAFTQLTPAWC